MSVTPEITDENFLFKLHEIVSSTEKAFDTT